MKKISFRPGRTVALAAIAAFTIGLANCADRETGKETVSEAGKETVSETAKIVEKTIVGEKSGLKYVVSVPEKGDPTIDSDVKELIAETEGMLAGLTRRTDASIAKLPPITITFVGKGKTLTGAPEQPEGKLDERFNDDTDGNPKVARRDAQVVSFTAIKPATRNSFDLGLPAQLRTLTLRDAEARKVTAGIVGKAGGRVSERIEPNKPGKLVPQGWSLNDDNRLRLGSVNQRVTAWPWRTIVQFNYGGGNSGCSGSLIGPRHVVTAAHCIISAGTDDYFGFTVSSGRGGSQFTGQSQMPGCPNSATQNCPSVGATYWYFVPSQWRAANTSNREQYDFGIIVIPNRLGDTVGWMGYWYAPINSLNTVNKYSRGYPSCNAGPANNPRIDDPADPLACPTCTTDLTTCSPQHLYGDGARCSIGNATNVDGSGYNRNFRMSCDGSAAMSGSPLYFYGNGNVGASGSVYYTAHDIAWLCGGRANSSSCANVTRADRLVRNTPEYSGWISYFRSTFQ